MPAQPIAPEDLKSLGSVLSYLQTEQPFRKLSSKIGEERFEHHYHLTTDIQAVIKLFKQSSGDIRGTGQRRIIAVHANIGDGKSSLLWYLKYKIAEKIWCIEASVTSEKKWQIGKDMLFQLLYVMKTNGKLEEKEYNQARVELKGILETLNAQAKVNEWLAKVKDRLTGHLLIWLLDNVRKPHYVESMQSFFALQDPEPPQRPFFEDVSNLIVFTTSELEVASEWKRNSNMEAAGHKLLPLRVGNDDALGIVDKILEGISKTCPDAHKPAFSRWRNYIETKLYPFERAGLEEFLRKKARKVPVVDNRVGIETELAEIQLRNTLLTLQRAIDSMPIGIDAHPVELEDLSRADGGS